MIKTNEIKSTLVDAAPRIPRQRQATIRQTNIHSDNSASITTKPSYVSVACDVLERALENIYAKYPDRRTAVYEAWAVTTNGLGTNAPLCNEPGLSQKGGQ